MTQTETILTKFWRDVDARLAAENEIPSTASEVFFHGRMFRAALTAEQAAASIIRQRVAAARASVKAA